MVLLVTDGDQRSTLAVVRSLGRAGIPVIVGADRVPCLAGRSRYCAGSINYPSPVYDPEGFRSFLCEEVSSERYQMLLPMTEVTSQLVGGLRERLSPLVQIPIPAEGKILLSQDKQAMVAKAQAVGISCPQTWVFDSKEELEVSSGKLPYPVVIKPRFSRLLKDGHWWQGTVEFASSPSELIAKWAKVHERIPGPLVQEMIQGEGKGVFLLVWNGELKAAFSHRRLREKPPWGGVSVYSESVPLDWDLVHKSVALLGAIDWQGVAMAEYKIDRRDGCAKFMEVNGRFWGSLQLAIDAGMNFPLLLYRLAMGESVQPQFDFRAGVKSRWLLGDLDHLLILLTQPHGMNVLPHEPVSKLRAIGHFLEFFQRDLYYEVLRLGDTRPGWFELKTYLHDILTGIGKRLEK